MPSAAALFDEATRHHQDGRLTEAEALYRQALAAHPAHTGSLHGLGLIAQATGHFDVAVALFSHVLVLLPDAAESVHALAYTLHAQGIHADSAAAYARALALDPGNARIHNNLGNLAKDQGDFARALDSYTQAIALDPGFAWAHYNRADLHDFTAGDAALQALEHLAEANPSPQDAVYLHFALAKAYGDLGDTARAFDHLLQGNALKRAQIAYDEAATLADLARTATPTQIGASDSAADPIFIVGMPRSGTTLIEQILSAHPDVHGAGETAAFDQAIAATAPGDLGALASTYLALLPQGHGKARVIDKMPGNFRNIGLIHAAFPKARIIHAVREPVDTCVACFSKLFSEGQAFTYDLAELGRYYTAYSHVMDHWRGVLPAGMMIDVAYEDVVRDLEGQTRRMLDFCGLSWDARCLAFHQHRRSVETASAVQVRRPLYATSVGRAAAYAGRLGPLLQALGQS